MLKKIIKLIKKEPSNSFYTTLAACLILLFASLFFFSILQSDDYYYAAFFKNGVGEFFRLTKDHFINTNGRALVHFSLQVVLALPKFFRVLINSAILFFICFFSFKISRFNERKHCLLYFIIFYSFIMLSGTNTLKETIMWASGFYNYVFPALITLIALYLCKTGSPWRYLFCFLSGATTEQWGITSCVMLTLFLIQSSHNFLEKKRHLRYIPVALSLLGYITIFISPATLSRIFVSGHTELTASLFDISRLAEAFFSNGSCVIIIAIFIIVTLFAAFVKKGAFKALYTALLPLCLILLLPFHHSYMAAFLVFLCYLILCAFLFYKEKYPDIAALLFGAITSIVIMLPTNTFDARITLPCALLLTLTSISIFLSVECNKKILLVSSIAIFTAAAVVFAPCYTHFYKNHLVDKCNMAAIKEAQHTKSLTYCIDYDKTYIMRQMFNDGWFYTTFLLLYNLEDCTVYLDSVNAKPLYYNGNKLTTKALISENEVYVPMRAFLSEAGGTITYETSANFELNGKKLVYLDGMLSYTASDGKTKYLVADDNKLLDFYTLYLKLNVVTEVFDISLSINNT